MVRQVLGKGSFGEVLEAADVKLERVVAIKLLRAEMQDAEQAARFAREGRVTAQLAHPNIVECLDHGVAADGTPYLVYELIQGETLLERMKRVGLRPPEEIRTVGAAIAGALRVAHEAGILHRDVKPENIMLRQDRTPVLCDFGVAHSEQADALETAEGILLGTLEYMAPELMLGTPASPETDTYALAATLYMLRFGEPPYPGVDPGRLADIARGKEGPRPPPPPVEDEALDHVLLRATAPQPRQRYPNLSALLTALGGQEMDRVEDTVVLTASSPDALGADTAAVGQPAPRRRRRALPWVIGGAGLLALAGTTWWWTERQAPPAVPAPTTAAPVVQVAVPTEVRDAWIRFAGFRVGAKGELDLAWGAESYRKEKLSALSKAILDHRFELRAKRFLQALRGWLTTGDPKVLATPEARDFLVEVTTVLRWLARDVDYAALQSSLGLRFADQEGTSVANAFREMDQAISFAAPFTQLTKSLEQTADEAIAAGRAPSAILLRAVWTGKYNGGDAHQVAEELWQAFHALEDPVLAAELLPWIAKITLGGAPTEVDCAELIGQTEELMALAGSPGRAPGRELWVLRELARAVTRVGERCQRSGLALDLASFAGAMRAAENAPLIRVRAFSDVEAGLVILRDSARDLLGPDAAIPALEAIDGWLERRKALEPILATHTEVFALPATATVEGTAAALDEAESSLLQRPGPKTIRALAVALVHWAELRRLVDPESLAQEGPRLRIQGALETLFDEIPSATPETAAWVDGALVRMATAMPPRDPCLAGSLRLMARRRQLPDLPWLSTERCPE